MQTQFTPEQINVPDHMSYHLIKDRAMQGGDDDPRGITFGMYTSELVQGFDVREFTLTDTADIDDFTRWMQDRVPETDWPEHRVENHMHWTLADEGKAAIFGIGLLFEDVVERDTQSIERRIQAVNDPDIPDDELFAVTVESLQDMKDKLIDKAAHGEGGLSARARDLGLELPEGFETNLLIKRQRGELKVRYTHQIAILGFRRSVIAELGNTLAEVSPNLAERKSVWGTTI